MGSRSRGGRDSGFGPILKQLREAAGLSQQQLADRAGMNLWGVAKLEQGKRDPAWLTVLDLADALGVQVTAFVPERPKKPKK